MSTYNITIRLLGAWVNTQMFTGAEDCGVKIAIGSILKLLHSLHQLRVGSGAEVYFVIWVIFLVVSIT